MADSSAYPGAPRWVKVLGTIALALAAVFVIVHLAGGGFRHHGAAVHPTSAGGSDRYQGGH